MCEPSGRKAEIWLLTDRPDDQVTWDDVLGAGDFLHLAFAIDDRTHLGFHAADPDDFILLG